MLELNERVGSEPKVVSEPEVIIRVGEDKKGKKNNNATTEEKDLDNVQ